MAGAIGWNEGRYRGDGYGEYEEKRMNTPTACPITKTPYWTAQANTNNNTPVNTEVLWGGGLWWGLLRADRVPALDKDQQVIDVGGAVMVDVALADTGCCMQCTQVICINITIAIEVTVICAVGYVVFAHVGDQSLHVISCSTYCAVLQRHEAGLAGSKISVKSVVYVALCIVCEYAISKLCVAVRPNVGTGCSVFIRPITVSGKRAISDYEA